MDILVQMNKTLAAFAPEITVSFTNYFSEGTYFKGERIELNREIIEKEYEHLKEIGICFQSADELTLAIFAHELGHHMDLKDQEVWKREKAYHNLYYACHYGHVDQIKQLFIEYQNKNYEDEYRACQQSLRFIPDTMDIEVFKLYNEYCLSTYRTLFKYEYRLHIIQAKIASLINHYLGERRTFALRFWMEHEREEAENVFDEKNRVLYLHLLPYAYRFKELADQQPCKKTLFMRIWQAITEVESLEVIKHVYQQHPDLQIQFTNFLSGEKKQKQLA